MKKFIYLITVLILPLTCIMVSGWMVSSSDSDDAVRDFDVRKPADSLAKNYFPLKTGNSWTYKSVSTSGDTLYIKSTVLYDTLIGNVRFFRLSNELPYFRGTLISLDTLTGNLYGYQESNKCDAFRSGLLFDSLGSRLGNKVFSCINRLYGKCMDTNSISIFGERKKTKFFLSPAFASSGVFNQFAENIGITYSFKIEGLNIKTARLLGCVLDNSIYGDTSTTTHIFGKVYYSDNNQPAQSGYVKAMKLNRANGDIMVLDSVQIQRTGDYFFHTLPNDDYYIVAYPNSEEQSDFVPTYFPSTINWQNAVRVNTGNNPENIKIAVYRKLNVGGSFSISGKVYQEINHLTGGINDANVYLRNGNIFVSGDITKLSGMYRLGNLAPGNFEIIVNRLGYVNLQQNISINNSNLQNINFFLEPTFINRINSTDDVPKGYSLNQNYPNPFNPVTSIKFDIPKTSFVSLKIYNTAGYETETLISEIKSPGSYTVNFNAANLSSGVYLYRLKTENFNATKRMVVVK